MQAQDPSIQAKTTMFQLSKITYANKDKDTLCSSEYPLVQISKATFESTDHFIKVIPKHTSKEPLYASEDHFVQVLNTNLCRSRTLYSIEDDLIQVKIKSYTQHPLPKRRPLCSSFKDHAMHANTTLREDHFIQGKTKSCK